MANGLTIRRARRADAPGFLSLLVSLAEFEKLQPPNAPAKKRIVRDVFERKKVELLMAFLDGQPVGYALYFFTYSTFLAKPTLYLEDLFVLKEFRGSGVGRSLLLRCVREARKGGCGRMEWEVLTWNRKAIRFYERMGARKLTEWLVCRLDERAIRRLARTRPA